MRPVVAIDLDGTMVDTALDFQAAINRMRAARGAPELSVDVIKGFVGKGSEHLVRSVLALDHPDDELDGLMPAALADYQSAYALVNGTLSSVYPGVREGLERLGSAGWRLACVTNKPHRFAVELLEKMGLLAAFDLVLGGDSVTRKKPDPEPFRLVCERLGVTPQQLVAIGDSTNDAQAARGAGCLSITVSYGYNHGCDVRELDTDAIVDSLLESALWLETHHSMLLPTHASR